MSSAEFQPLSVRVEQGPSGRVLSASGEIDTLTAPQLRSRVAESLPGAGEVLVIDLSGVTFLSSAGLSVLAQAHHDSVAAGGSVRIVTGPGTARVFQLTGLAETLNLFDSLVEARD